MRSFKTARAEQCSTCPRGKYKLVRNLECTGGAAVEIVADNVQFDLGRKSIPGTGTSRGIYIDTATGVQITGGSINPFDAKIVSSNGSQCQYSRRAHSQLVLGVFLTSASPQVIGNTIENYEFGVFNN